MKPRYKIVSLLFWVSFLFSIEAVAECGNCEDGNIAFTEHNDDPDANLTSFILDGSNSSVGSDLFQWTQIGGGPTVNIENANAAIASFQSAVAYGGADIIYEFQLAVENSNGDTDTDTILITVKSEKNTAPIVIFNLDEFAEESTSENLSYECSGDIEFGLDGFPCTIENFNARFIQSIQDPDFSYNADGEEMPDEYSYEWLYNGVSLPTDASTGEVLWYTFDILPFEQGQKFSLYIQDNYNDENEYEITLIADISNTIPTVIISSIDVINQNGEVNTIAIESVNSVDEETTYTLFADVTDPEHTLDDMIVTWTCSNGLICDEENVQVADQTVSVDFTTPVVQYNSDNIQHSIVLEVKDPYQNADNEAQLSSDQITINIGNINKAPIITGHIGEIIANEEEQITINLSYLVYEDEDNVDEDISLEVLGGDNYQSSGFNIIPTTESESVEQIFVNVRINDGEGFDNNQTSETYNLPVTVNPINDRPIIGVGGNISIQEDNSFSLSLEDIDIDNPPEEESDVLELIILNNQTDNYSIDESINPAIITPDQDFNGTIIVQVRVSDEGGNDSTLSNILDLPINITPLNDPPVSNLGDNNAQFDLSFDEDFGDNLLLDFDEVFTDVDGDILNFNYNLNPAQPSFLSDAYNTSLNQLFLSSIEHMNSIDETCPNYNSLSDCTGSNGRCNWDFDNNECVFDGQFEYLNITTSAADVENMIVQNSWNIAVIPKNDAPVFDSGSDSLSMTFGVTIDANGDGVITDDERHIEEGYEQTSLLVDLTTNVSEWGPPGPAPTGYDTPYAYDIELDNWYYQVDVDGDGIIDDVNPGIDYIDQKISTDNGYIVPINETSFTYYPNPGFRCVDQFSIQIKDDGIDYFYNEGFNFENAYRTSPIGTVSMIVDFCNLAPTVDENGTALSSVHLVEDGELDISTINLSSFTFEDPDDAEELIVDVNENGQWNTGDEFIDLNGNGVWDDADELVSVHALIWNDCGTDGLCPNDEGYIAPDSDGTELNNQWDKGEGWDDCGTDGLCPDDEGYTTPDSDGTEFNGQWNEGEKSQNKKYTVTFECSLPFTNQDECEYNGGLWNTTIYPVENYNGPLYVALQGNDGEESHNLSDPFIGRFNVKRVNDPPIIKNAFLSNENGTAFEIFNEDGTLLDTLRYVFEDTTDVRFNVIFEDIDSDPDLNLDGDLYNLDDMTFEFPTNSNPGRFFCSFNTDLNTFKIDGLYSNWNGNEDILIKAWDNDSGFGTGSLTHEYIFNLTVRPVNDLPTNFSAHIYPNEALPDTSLFEDEVDLESHPIRYSVWYSDVDKIIDLNQYEGYEFVPDTLVWLENYTGSNFTYSIEAPNDSLEFDLDNNGENIGKYIREVTYKSLRQDWNGFDSIPIDLKANIDDEEPLGTIYFSLETLPLSDPAAVFDIDEVMSGQNGYAMDETTFYVPCELSQPDDNCEELIHGFPFTQEDNFFRLHNEVTPSGLVDIEASVNYTNFDAGKILFKWDRTYDVDLDGSISQYPAPYNPNLIYRVELIAQDEVYEDCGSDGVCPDDEGYLGPDSNGSEANNQYDQGEEFLDTNDDEEWTPSDNSIFVVAEINDNLFNNPQILCEQEAGDSDLCSDPDFSFLTNANYGWAIVNLKDLFFKYQVGFYDNPDIDSGPPGFYTSPDFSQDNYSQDYIDYYGTTEYKWRVLAYNDWWDHRSNTESYQNTEIAAESEQMRFFVDLERPFANFSVVQNPLFLDLYELYMLTNEEIDTGQSKLYITDENGNTSPVILSPFNDDLFDIFYYAGEFQDNVSLYEFRLLSLDLLENGGISNYAFTHINASPGVNSRGQSPSNIAELIIPGYSLVQSASFIMSEKENSYEDINMISISKQIEIVNSHLNVQSPFYLRFLNDFSSEINRSNVKIAKKDQFDNWNLIDSNSNSEFIQAEISEGGIFGLFYVYEVEEIVPENFSLIGCYPNPFNPNVNIEFTIPYKSDIKLNIYDVAGKKIKTLIDSNLEAGFINVAWNGVNDSGSSVSSGIYFVVLEKGSEKIFNKVTMVK